MSKDKGGRHVVYRDLSSQKVKLVCYVTMFTAQLSQADILIFPQKWNTVTYTHRRTYPFSSFYELGKI
jgi:hypothetical protein